MWQEDSAIVCRQLTNPGLDAWPTKYAREQTSAKFLSQPRRQ